MGKPPTGTDDQPVRRGPSPEDLRVEYQATNDFYIMIGGTRFTIAGFYLAATGLLGQFGLGSEASESQRCLVAVLGFLLGLIAWMLELRSRLLCREMWGRMVNIERNHWFSPEDWYSGAQSGSNKTLPTNDHPDRSRIPTHPGPGKMTIAWLPRPLPSGLSRRVTHSMAFDLLYPVTMIFWVAVFAFALRAAIR